MIGVFLVTKDNVSKSGRGRKRPTSLRNTKHAGAKPPSDKLRKDRVVYKENSDLLRERASKEKTKTRSGKPLPRPEAIWNTTLPEGPLFLRGLNLAQMQSLLMKNGHPTYRAQQIFDWVFAKGVPSIEQMTNLTKDLRVWLNDNVPLGGLELVDVDGESDETQKLVFRDSEGHFVESVLMRDDFMADEEDVPPSGSTAALKKVSLCLSSQVGCALACEFCMTGLGGFRRNLRTDEIIDQFLVARRLIGDDERIANVVYMGMGEPMLNVNPVVDSLRLLTAPEALGMSRRKVTVSTAGVLAGMAAFARAGTEVNLAISLHATTQKTRDRLMPGCKRWPLTELMDACRDWPLTKRRRITFEYVLLQGINDTEDDRKRLVKLLAGIPCKVNLMLYNPTDAKDLTGTDEAAAESFRQALVASNFTASIRRSKGRKNNAACGQLAAHFQREKG